MATELTGLKLQEVSAVDAPANDGARMLLLKRSDSDASREADEIGGLLARLARYLKFRKDDAWIEFKEDSAMPDDLTKQLQNQLKALEEKVTKLESDNSESAAIIKAIEEIDKATTPEAVDAIVGKLDSDEVKKRVATRVDRRKADLEAASVTEAEKAFREKLPESLRDTFDKMNRKDRDAFMKSMTPNGDPDNPVTKALKELADRRESDRRELEKLKADAELQKVRDELAPEFKGVVEDFDKLASNVVSLRKHDAAGADGLLAELRRTAKQAREGGLFKVLGHGDDTSGKNVAIQKLDTAVKKYRDEHPDVSAAEAEVAVLNQHPELYTEYVQAQEG